MANELFFIPPDNSVQFDELYVISDLHLGGPSDFQIFNSSDELVRLINYLINRLPDKKIALLINGDFVDFLAESPAKHFDPEGAVDKLNRIAGWKEEEDENDSYFKPVFGALRDFASTQNRRLIINLGNHDLELALPWVRAQLLEILTGGDEAAHERIILAFDGAGFRCQVGNAKVLCVHGNEVDSWNVADYEKIRRFGREVTQGRPISSWIPNAGTQLVIDVMNDLKRKYPFIDLLKPENEAAIPILLALAPNQRDKLLGFLSSVRRRIWDIIRMSTGLLGSDDVLVGRTVEAAGVFSTQPSYFPAFGTSGFDRQEYANMLLDETQERFRNGVEPMSLLNNDELGEYLGIPSAIIKLFQGEETHEILREALNSYFFLENDRSFDPSTEDSTFTGLDKQIGDGFDFLITGHTHLARALIRRKKKGWYFNSGTWARLIKLEDRILKSPKEFKKVFETFKVGSMKALDEHPELVSRILTVVVIRNDGKQTHGELRQVNPNSTKDILPQNTAYRFTKTN